MENGVNGESHKLDEANGEKPEAVPGPSQAEQRELTQEEEALEERALEAERQQAQSERRQPQAEAQTPPESQPHEAAQQGEADHGHGHEPGYESESEPGPEHETAEETATVAPESEVPITLAMRRRSHVAPALVAIDRIEDDETYQIRPEGDVMLLATDIARVGQLFPIELRLRPPDRFQIVSGFRRVAALKFLHRDKVLARLHVDLSDDDALLMALAAAIHAKPVTPEELSAVKERLESQGRLNAAARDMLEKAISPEDNLAPEEVGGEQEVDADELAADVASRLGTINQELALLADVFDSLDESRRAELLMQLRYSSELVAYLENK